MKDRGGEVAGIAITFLILTWLTVGLRCYARTFIVKAFGLDDKVMVATLFFFTAYLACQLGGAVHGTGQHRDQLTDESAQTALRYWFFCEVFYTISTSILKIAVGLFLLRITIVPYHVWIIRTIMLVAAFVGVAYTLLVIFQCKPISYWWDLNPDHTGTCLSASMVMNFTYIVSALNSFADWTFGTLPIFIVKDLQMKKRVKILVSSIIGLAAIGSTATIIRLPYTSSLKEYKGDFLYRTTDFAIWTTVEVGIGITAGCVATLKPLLSATMGSTAQASGKPWIRSSKYLDSHGSQPLDNLRPAAERTTRTTTVTGGRLSHDSDEEAILGTSVGELPAGRKSGINKSVTTTVVTEYGVGKSAEGSKQDLKQASHSQRSGSLGEESFSTLEEEGRGKLARIHERL